MPTYVVTDSRTGVKLRLTGDSPPTESELTELFAQHAPEQKYDPTEGMSGTEKFAAAYGGVMPKIATGIKQGATEIANAAQGLPASFGAIPGVGGAIDLIKGGAKLAGVNDDMVAQQRAAADEQKHLDAPLLNTGAGKAGNIAGNVAAAIPAAFIPGANTYSGSALTGALYGGAQPTGADDSRTENMGFGAATGMASQALGRLVGAGYQAGKAYLAPLTQKGQEGIVARTLARFSANPDALLTGGEESAIPGVQRTLAEATLDPGIAGLQLATKNSDPIAKSQLLGQELKNQGARLSALNDIAQTPAARQAAVAAREAATKPLYEAASTAQVPADDALKTLLNRPSLQKAWARAAQLAGERGEKLVSGQDIPAQVIPTGLLDANGKPFTKEIAEQSATYSGKGLHYLKMALDDLIDNPQVSGIGKNELGAITGTKKELLNWMDNAIEPYGAARKTFSQMSQPINQMDVGRQLYEKLVPALTENSEIPTRVTAQQYANALRNAEQTVKSATGMDMPIEKIMSPEQMATLKNIASDLGRKASTDDLAKTLGSTTAQNLAAQNLMRQTMGPLGVPNGWMEGEAMPSIAQALMAPYKLTGADQAINQRLAEALMNPKKAAELLQRVPAGDKGKLVELLSRAAVPAGILSRPDTSQ